MRTSRLILCAALGASGACTSSTLPVAPSWITRIEVPSPTDPADSSLSTPIEVRHYAHSPTVTIVAWEPNRGLYGLQAFVRRDGSLIRDRHRLFVSTYYTAAPPAFSKAATRTRVLRLTRIAQDPYWCLGGTPCLPPETFGALIPDSFLRSHPDSIPVVFSGRAGRTLPITLHGDLIRAYLATIDSIVAVLHRPPRP